jgi:hypothetical protein
MHSNQSWPPVISPLGVHPCFRNATRAKQGCCRDWQGHTVFVSILLFGTVCASANCHSRKSCSGLGNMIRQIRNNEISRISKGGFRCILDDMWSVLQEEIY